MTTSIEGITITLTQQQVAAVQRELKRRERAKRSFIKILRHFGFKKCDDLKTSFVKGNWFADILDRGGYCEVWITGEGLKSINGFPGGWVYSSPQEISEELVKAIDNLNHWRLIK